ncbi:MAG: RodZ domain-containing protein, partial [Terriglobales bacterium]
VESPTRENARDNTRANVAHEPESGRLEIRAEVASRQLPWGILAVVLLIIALGLSLWNYHRQQERLTSQSKPAPRASQIVEQSTSPAVAPGSAPQPSSVSEPMNPPPVATTPPSAEESLPTASQPLPNTAAATSAPAEFLVLLHARDESWVSVFVDGKPAGSETLEAGDERTFRGRQRVTVKAGNAAALDLRLNGRALPIVGDVGEVKTITIGPAGMIPGTASTPAP